MATHGDGFSLFTRLGAKTFNDLDFNVLFGEAFNVLHETFFIQTHQVDGCAISPCAARAANAVNVVFADVRDFIVHHVRQVVNVNAPCGDIGRHQSPDVTTFETAQRLCTRSLALVAMQRHRVDAVFGQVFGDVVGTEFGAREHQHLAPILLVDDVCQQGFLFAAPDGMNHLGNALHRRVARRDLHTLRILEQSRCQVADFVTERGREEQALLFFGYDGQHFFHVMNEAHIEHSIGFVQHQHLHLAQIQNALLHQVQQATRCSHQNVNAFFYFADLGVHADATEYHGGGQLQKFAVGLYRLFHLCGQLAGGGEHQRADARAAEFVGGATGHRQFMQHRQYKGGRFASAGLGAAQQVMPGQHHRNGFSLDCRGGFVTMLAHGFHNGRSQFQIIKVHVRRTRPGARSSAHHGTTGAPESVKAESVRGGTGGLESFALQSSQALGSQRNAEFVGN